jgi:hypothetical protein
VLLPDKYVSVAWLAALGTSARMRGMHLCDSTVNAIVVERLYMRWLVHLVVCMCR